MVTIVGAALLLLSGCIPVAYDDVPVGRFEGVIELRWLFENHFLYTPHPEAPFRFIRANGEVIQPGPMVTDGGSVPPFFWGEASLNPWTYAPAYLLHDWLFRGYVCGYLPADAYTFRDTALIMAEALKTQMETNPRSFNRTAYDLIAASTAGPAARFVYRNNECQPLPDGVVLEAPGD
jgi:hypothetical protein